MQLVGLICSGLGDLAVLPFTPANLTPEQRQQHEAQSTTWPIFLPPVALLSPCCLLSSPLKVLQDWLADSNVTGLMNFVVNLLPFIQPGPAPRQPAVFFLIGAFFVDLYKNGLRLRQLPQRSLCKNMTDAQMHTVITGVERHYSSS